MSPDPFRARLHRVIHYTYDDFRENGALFVLRYFVIRLANQFLRLVSLSRKVRRRLRWQMQSYIRKAGRLPRNVTAILPSPIGVRRCIYPAQDANKFFSELNRRGVEYVVLRWFDDLPSWSPGEDIDLLIEDSDIPKIGDLFTYNPKTYMCDLFTIGSTHTWNGISYYPPVLAKKILESRVMWKDICYIPNPETHFFSLMYHAVYHKGSDSGLPMRHAEDAAIKHPKHAFARDLTELGAQQGFRFNPNLVDMHTFLTEHGWSPQLDTLRKLSAITPSLRELVPTPMSRESHGELTVFVVREWTIKNDKLNTILNIIKRHLPSFEILKVLHLDDRQRKLATDYIRGGDWSPGISFPVGGGEPEAIIVTVDRAPISVPDSLQEKHPYITNGNFRLKERLRYDVLRDVLSTRWANSIHSSDDETEAWEYLEILDTPGLIPEMRKKLET